MQEWLEAEVIDQGFLVVLIGGVMIGVGIPVAVRAGGKKRRYQQAMEQAKTKPELSFRVTANGIALLNSDALNQALSCVRSVNREDSSG